MSIKVSKPLGEPKHFMSGAAFVSTTSRWTGDGRHLDQPGPGKPPSPVLATFISYFLFMHVLESMGFFFIYFLAHYRPIGQGKQSFIYNASSKWI